MSKNCFFFLPSMSRLLGLALSFLLFLYCILSLRELAWFSIFMDLTINFNGPDFLNHLSNFDPSQFHFSSSPIDTVTWMLLHYVKRVTKQSLSSLSLTNFSFQLCFSSWDVIVVFDYFFFSSSLHFLCLISCCLSIFLFPQWSLYISSRSSRVSYCPSLLLESVFFNLTYMLLSVIS